MPRGRHRHSPPLHRFLPPAAVALVAVVSAAATWFLDDLLVVRVLAVVAAAAAVTDAVLARVWDRAAGRRVADLTRARTRDEWHSEERVAELETEVEEARTRRTALESALRAKRAELARMRSEHAELLRRYATAETKRANALEGRRLLELEAATPQGLPRQGRPAANTATTPAQDARSDSARAAVTTTRSAGADRPAAALDAAAYRRAAEALHHFARNASRQTWNRHALPPGARPAAEAPAAEAPATEGATAESSTAEGAAGAAKAGTAGGEAVPSGTGPTPPEASAGGGAAGVGGATGAADAAPEGEDLFAGRATDVPVGGGSAEGKGLARRGAGLGSRPAAATVSGRRTMSRQVGGFDFFGTSAVRPAEEEDGEFQAGPQDAAGAPGDREPSGGAGARGRLGEDLADVVGDEAVADQSARAAGERDADSGEVIDLTSHDETEQLDVAPLRNSASG